MPSYFFSTKIPQHFFIWHLQIFKISYYPTKKSQVVSKSVKVIFFEEKNKLRSNNSEMYNSPRNGKKTFRRLMAVSSQFLNKHHKSNCHTKAHCCKSFFGWVPASVLMVSKSGTPFLFTQNSEKLKNGQAMRNNKHAENR